MIIVLKRFRKVRKIGSEENIELFKFRLVQNTNKKITEILKVKIRDILFNIYIKQIKKKNGKKTAADSKIFSKIEEVTLSEITPDTDSDRPMTPNLLMILIKSREFIQEKVSCPWNKY
jgi:hypothetical protein